MKRIYLSMMKRVEYPTRVGYGDNGRIIVLDWETKTQVTNPILLYDLRKPDNPLTRSHGTRGLAFHQGKLYVAGGHQVLSIVDLDRYCVVKTFEIPSKLTHQLKEKDGVLYLVSTGDDRYYKMQGEEIIEEVCVSPHNENTLHFNSIGWDPAGDEYHVYYKPGQVFNFSQNEVVYTGNQGLHDVCFVDQNTMIVNDSMARKSLRVRQDEVSTIYEAAPAPDGIEFRGEKAKDNHALWGFTRVAIYSGNSLFLSSAPGRLVEVDTISWEQKEIFDITLDPGDSLYDIALDPRDWS